MSQVYSIKLRFDVDDAQLQKAKAQLGSLYANPNNPLHQKARTPTDYWSRTVNKNKNLRLIRRRMRTTGGLQHYNKAKTIFGQLGRSFLGNSVTISGLARNVGLLTRGFGQLGLSIAKIHPAVTALAAFFGTYLFSKIARLGMSGLGLFAGNKMLQSEKFGTGASNLMQMNIAKNILGERDYKEAWKSASLLSTQYGFSRTQSLGTMAALRGLNVGGRELKLSDTAGLVRGIGKISQSGSVPYERASTNLMQLLGSDKINLRDLREIIHGTPIFQAIVRDMMKSSGSQNTDMMSWLKDKANLINAIAEFDRKVQTNPFMESRGRVQVASENFFMKLVEDNKTIWPMIAKNMENFYKSLAPIANQWIQKLPQLITPENINKLLSGVNAFAKSVFYVVNTFAKIADFMDSKGFKFLSLRVGAFFDIGTGHFGQAFKKDKEAFKLLFGLGEDNNYGNGWGTTSSAWKPPMAAHPYQTMAIGTGTNVIERKQAALSQANIPRAQWNKYMWDNQYWQSGLGKESFMLPPDEATQLGLSPINANLSTQDDLSGVTKESRGLIINFNREIVNMPVTIDTVNNGDDLVSRLNTLLPDMIVRGMGIALNNATGAV